MARPTAKDTSNMAFSRPLFYILFAIITRICVSYAEDVANNNNTQQTLDLNQNQSVPFLSSNSNVNSSEPIIPVFSVKNITTKLFPERYARFLSISQGHYAPLKSIEDNEIDDKNDAVSQEGDPMVPLYEIYKDCLFRLSFKCVQQKILVALDQFSRMKSINLLGDLLSIVRTKRELGPVIRESELEARLNPDDATNSLSALLEYNLERFLQQHVLRVTLPAGMTASVTSNARSFPGGSIGNTIDINITRALEEMGRGKGDKKMKKLMGMMMTGLMGKMAFMGPMMILLIKLKALKALILSKIALMLSLFQLLKGGGKKGGGGKEVIIVHDAHGGGGGHDSYGGSSGWASGGGGGGWSGGGGGGSAWLAQGDSYSSGAHTGGGDATYAGSDAYATGGNAAAAAGGGGWAGGGGGGGGGNGWGRRSATDPHWVAYKAYVPPGEE
ncbi:uncharacterized protein LOC135840453 isoform X2 [Planococcus citri]|uniref:uncharacterized protein LOC135840453 isoform X2 n=1 Tax=Planococcus citri TaxID=170843 RepID=UPI0031F74E90